MASSETLRSGDRVGPYRLVDELGRGGMGEVWSAVRADGTLDREVAVKVLHAELHGAEPVGRFLREREILSALDHPGIARILDGGATDEGRQYLVMEAIAGTGIYRYCEERALAPESRLRLVVDAARTLGAAHARNVVHRDVKPANLLVDASGRVRVLDFGIARWTERALGRDAYRTVGPSRFMTKDYASPEQMEGRAVEPASDVFSLGVVAHLLVTGELPPPVASLSLGAADRQRRAGLRRFPGDVGLVLSVALQPEPSRRYPTGADLADDLERALEGVPVRARQLRPLDRFVRSARRNARALAASAVVLVALAALLAAAWSAHGDADASRNRSAALAAQAEGRLDALRGTVQRVVSGTLQGLTVVPNTGTARERVVQLTGVLADQHDDDTLRLEAVRGLIGLARSTDAPAAVDRYLAHAARLLEGIDDAAVAEVAAGLRDELRTLREAPAGGTPEAP
ncbi:MAG: serine/threonine-protein kinase [Planctomycetota bacterium]